MWNPGGPSNGNPPQPWTNPCARCGQPAPRHAQSCPHYNSYVDAFQRHGRDTGGGAYPYASRNLPQPGADVAVTQQRQQWERDQAREQQVNVTEGYRPPSWLLPTSNQPHRQSQGPPNIFAGQPANQYRTERCSRCGRDVTIGPGNPTEWWQDHRRVCPSASPNVQDGRSDFDFGHYNGPRSWFYRQ